MDEDRANGVLLGLACGDALGRPIEFKTAQEIDSVHGTLTDMVGHGTWGQPAGTITDDTDQALCIARSLVECGTFDPEDIAERFVQWYDTDPFDIGNMTRRSLEKLKRGVPWDQAGRQVWENSPEGSNAGNGSVMRCPPLAIAYYDDYDILIRVSKQSSEITHADPRCTYGCAILNLTIAGILRDDSEPLTTALELISPDVPDELVSGLEPIADERELHSISPSGYVVDSLRTAMYDGLRAENAESAIVNAVNRGGDTDTIGAITGAIAGARFGAEDLPDQWLETIEESTELTAIAGKLHDFSPHG